MIRSGKQGGFTLLEVLVAFMVLAVAGGALLQLFHGGLQNLTAGEGYSRAALWADSTLSRLRAAPGLSGSGEEGVLEPGYRYQVSLSPYEEDGQVVPNLLQADLIISWGETSDARTFEVRTLILPPGKGP